METNKPQVMAYEYISKTYIIKYIFSIPPDGWSNWYALQFTANLLVDTDSYLETCSVALDEIYFAEDCSQVTATPPVTDTTLPTDTTPLPPNVGLILF